MYKEMMDSIGMIQSIDPELGSAMNEELHRQRQNIELIASENIVSPGVMAARTRNFPAFRSYANGTSITTTAAKPRPEAPTSGNRASCTPTSCCATCGRSSRATASQPAITNASNKMKTAAILLLSLYGFATSVTKSRSNSGTAK